MKRRAPIVRARLAKSADHLLSPDSSTAIRRTKENSMHCIRKDVSVFCLLAMQALLAATATLRGIVHDPQHRPLPGAQVVLAAPAADEDRAVRRQRRISDRRPPGGRLYGQCFSAGLPDAGTAGHGHRGQNARAAFSAGAGGRSVRASRCPAPASKLSTQTSTVQTMVSPQEIAANRRRGSDQQPGDDHRFHARALTWFTTCSTCAAAIR